MYYWPSTHGLKYRNSYLLYKAANYPLVEKSISVEIHSFIHLFKFQLSLMRLEEYIMVIYILTQIFKFLAGTPSFDNKSSLFRRLDYNINN